MCNARKSKDPHIPTDKKKPAGPRQTHYVDDQGSDTSEDEAYKLYILRDRTYDLIIANIWINDIRVTMEIDTGAFVCIINSSIYDTIAPHEEHISHLQPSKVQVHRSMLGTVPVQVNCEVCLSVHTVSGEGPNLMDWLSHFDVSLGRSTLWVE